MHLRFEAARRIEQAIASSDLKRAHAEAHDLAALDNPRCCSRGAMKVGSSQQARC